MKRAIFTSDYSPDTKLTLIQSDDGDIVIDIHGDGEMRIATSGGKLHGEHLVSVITQFSAIIDALREANHE